MGSYVQLQSICFYIIARQPEKFNDSATCKHPSVFLHVNDNQDEALHYSPALATPAKEVASAFLQ
jgi:hypothetical protein